MRATIRSVLAVTTVALLAQQSAAATVDFKNENGILNSYVGSLGRTVYTLGVYGMLKCEEGEDGTFKNPRNQKLIDIRQEFLYPLEAYAGAHRSSNKAPQEQVYGGFKILKAEQLNGLVTMKLQHLYDQVTNELEGTDFAKNYEKQVKYMQDNDLGPGDTWYQKLAQIGRSLGMLTKVVTSYIEHPVTINCQNLVNRVVALKHAIYTKALEVDQSLSQLPYFTKPQLEPLTEEQKASLTALSTLCVDKETKAEFIDNSSLLTALLDYRSVVRHKASEDAAVYSQLRAVPEFVSFVDSGKAAAVGQAQEKNYQDARNVYAKELAQLDEAEVDCQSREDKLNEELNAAYSQLDSKKPTDAEQAKLQGQVADLNKKLNALEEEAENLGKQRDAYESKIDEASRKKNETVLSQLSAELCPQLAPATRVYVQVKTLQSEELKAVNAKLSELESAGHSTIYPN